ncbi:hypothetical protein TeGR_g7309 [Tetraparma gracilis]|uniref:phosphoribosylaminoimidazole carboxylase n=1 Tax=Tetraparma gracilis TaxID=2962635 RepID=A0ABQ6M4B9_9STRA|nr:hypothetical protein TeGR_g7309 [Tetraparma gracilis]
MLLPLLRRSLPRTRLLRLLSSTPPPHPPPPPFDLPLNETALSSFYASIQPPSSASSTPPPAPSSLPSSSPSATPEARLDHTRQARTGFPEVVFGSSKTPLQVATILESLAAKSESAVLATRITPEAWASIQSLPSSSGASPSFLSTLSYCPSGRCITVPPSPASPPPPSFSKTILVVTAGTTDIPVAEECALTLEACGVQPVRLFDCGVAGLHRIVSQLPLLASPAVSSVIVIAGMDGALPSVVAGLVQVPVIAVPTSIGYGASFGGIASALA